MRLLMFALVFLTVGPVAAQQGQVPYSLTAGERVRLVLAPAPGAPGTAGGAYLVGRVRSTTKDSLALVPAEGPARSRTLAWTQIERVARRDENRTGEVLGMVLGGVVGGLTGYVLGDALSDDPLAKVAFIPGTLGGLLVGGIIGARTGERWEDVPPARVTLGLRATIPIR